MPASYVTATIICSFGGLLLGIDTSSIGPITIMDSFVSELGGLSPALHGFIISLILISAAVSSFFAGRLADTLGRIPAIAIGAGVLCLGVVIQAGARNIVMLAAGRFVEGVGYGLFFGTQTVYICEISPPGMRGPLMSLPQFLICVGLVVGYFTCYGTASISGTLSWRLPFILLASLAALYVGAVLLFLPPSPRWLIQHGRQAEADKVWDLFQVKHQDRLVMEQEVRLDILTGQDAELIPRPRMSSFADLFSPQARGRTALAVFLMSFLQLCGIDAVLYASLQLTVFTMLADYLQYAPLLFQQAGLASAEASFLASGISGIVIVVTSIPAFLLADGWGRKTSVLAGGIGLTLTMLLMATLYTSNAVRPGDAAAYVVMVCIYLYCIIDATTWAISIKVYAPEIQPQATRAQATSIAYGLNWLSNWFVAFVAPILLARSSSAAYWLFGGCTAIATVVSVLFMVETRGKSLDEIDEAFAQAGEQRRRTIDRCLKVMCLSHVSAG